MASAAILHERRSRPHVDETARPPAARLTRSGASEARRWTVADRSGCPGRTRPARYSRGSNAQANPRRDLRPTRLVRLFVERSLVAYNVVKLVGAGYLIFLGVQAFRHRHSVAEAALAASPPKTIRRILREGFVVGITNPKIIVFASAALPQFVDRSRGHVPLQMIVLALLFQVLATASDGTYGLLAGTARQWIARSPKRLSMLSGGGGIAIVGLGVNLAVSRRRD